MGSTGSSPRPLTCSGRPGGDLLRIATAVDAPECVPPTAVTERRSIHPGVCLPPDRRQLVPYKITRKGGRRPSRVTRSALAGDLVRLHTEAPGGWPALAARAPGADRCDAQPVRGAAGTARAPTPPWPGGPKSGKRRPGRATFSRKARPVTGTSCAASGSPTPRAALTQEPRPAGSGALRAPLMSL